MPGDRDQHWRVSYRGVWLSCLLTPGRFLFVLALLLGGCAGPASRVRLPDDVYGHRYEGYEGRRQTITITPPDTTIDYFYYPVYVDSLHIRPAPFDSTAGPGAQVPVEVLVKGTLPDGCSELHAVEQRRAGHIIELEPQMRRPRSVSCVRVERPFRYYMMLDGLYGPGDYIIKIGRLLIFPFVVETPEPVNAASR